MLGFLCYPYSNVSKITTVTLQTDGLRDFVCLPDGVRYILGTVSVLKVVSSLVRDSRLKRRALDEFNKKGQTVVTLDVDKMFEMLAPRSIGKFAHGSSLIQPQRQAHLLSREGNNMAHPQQILDTRIAHLENTIRELDARSAKGNRIPSGLLRNLRQAAITLKDYGDQSKNEAYYDLGEPVVNTIEDPGAWTPPASVSHPLGKSAGRRSAAHRRAMEEEVQAGDDLMADDLMADDLMMEADDLMSADIDSMVADEIEKELAEQVLPKQASSNRMASTLRRAEQMLQQIAEASDGVETLKESGEEFDHVQAQEDLHELASQVQEVLGEENIDVMVADQQLAKMARHVDHIHGLFVKGR